MNERIQCELFNESGNLVKEKNKPIKQRPLKGLDEKQSLIFRTMRENFKMMYLTKFNIPYIETIKAKMIIDKRLKDTIKLYPKLSLVDFLETLKIFFEQWDRDGYIITWFKEKSQYPDMLVFLTTHVFRACIPFTEPDPIKKYFKNVKEG